MPEPLLIAWADARPEVGLGHVVRTYALAQAWADRGGRSMLCVSSASDAARAIVADAQVELCELGPACAPVDEAGGAALGGFARSVGARWVSVDSYATTAVAQRAMRACGVRVLVIDDHGIAAPYDCDLHVDQNLGAQPVAITTGARFAIAGLPYALLRRQFRAPFAGGPRDRVVVSLGGKPTPAVVALGARAAVRIARRVPVDLVLGGAALPPGYETHPAVQVHDVTPEPWTLFAGGLIAVSASGSTAWELCASATPSVLVAVAENQQVIGNGVAHAGAGVYLGRASDVVATEVATCVEALLDAPEELAAMAQRAASLVDGSGAARVAAQMAATELHVRPATKHDVEQYFVWANDPAVRAVSFNVAPIAWHDHIRWFGSRLARDDCWMYVVEDDAREPLGQIRFDGCGDDDQDVVVGISLDARARGRGLGAPLIIAGLRELAHDASVRVVHAEVRATNTASARSFLAAGFTHRSRDIRADGEVDTFAHQLVGGTERTVST